MHRSLSNLLRRFAAFSPRRRLLLAVVAGGTTGMLAWPRRDGYTVETVLSAVCDSLLPASGRHPGALALALEQRIIDEWGAYNETHRHSLLDALRAVNFLELDGTGRAAVLREMIDRRDNREAVSVLRTVLHSLVRHYLAHPAAWAALDYHKPQPDGYPDYADCTARGQA